MTAGELRLHLGCGVDVVPGWVNIDRSPNVLIGRVPGLRRTLAAARVLTPEQAGARFPAKIVRADVNRGLAYPDASVAFIYSSHLIEHLSRWQALALVRECGRVLRPGGVVRFACPDLAVLTRAYLERKDGDEDARRRAADLFMEELGTFEERWGNPIQRLSWRVFSAAPHQWLYDADSLIELLRRGGLTGAGQRRYREGEVPDLDRLERRPESVFVEATR